VRYEILIERRAQRALARVPPPQQGRIISAIQALAKEPRPHGVTKLTGRDAWRIRVGSYHVLYEIHDSKLIVLVVAVGHRRDVYQG
jgi:mRNA interferase RelE/StbE